MIAHVRRSEVRTVIGGTATITDAFSDALIYAERSHRPQLRKGTEIPYISR
jgi:hypothetical protein